MNETHVVVGAGAVGSAVARLLASQGQRVRLVTRSGSGPELPEVELIAADAADTARLTGLCDGAAALYNCANPPYTQWRELWPPLHRAMTAAASSTGAVLAITSNLYGYGYVDVPMTEDLPLAARTRKGRVRAWMWETALAEHDAGRLRAVEVRGSDYIGPDASSAFMMMAAPKIKLGQRATVIGALDQPHTYTAPTDMARTLVAVAGDPDAHGRAWHAPSNPAVTQGELAADFAAAYGAAAPRLRRIPDLAVRAGGLFVPMLREVAEMLYQFDRPFVMDSSAAQERLGLAPTPWEEMIAAAAGSVSATS